MRKCIVLNTLELTSKKQEILASFFAEYLKALNITLKALPASDSSAQLHHLTYSNIRKTSFLPSDIVQEARKDVWAKRKTIKNGFFNCSIRLNHRWFKYISTKRNTKCFKITYSYKKAFAIPIKKDRQFQRFNDFINAQWQFDNISVLQDSRIAVILEKVFDAPKNDNKHVVGIDIGSSTLAAVSVYNTETKKIVRQLYFGRDVAIRQRKYIKRRAKLQGLGDKGSQKARKSLARLKHNQFNFVKTRSAQIAKEIANLAKDYGASIAIERLKNIRGKRKQFNKVSNQKISKIPYAKFKEFLNTNCQMFSIPLNEADAYHTSKWCPVCGAVNNGHCSSNYSIYKCNECGLIMNSDRKASLAVAIKSVLERTAKTVTRVQISNTEVPVNGLFRPHEVGLNQVVVQHSNQLMESPRL
ncbi:IS200/IS605 family element transposase accessory protein TnpB [Candidatus Micrarchaeota archaeon]|nr:IS200/IS605 family element transposase accessory protein TnpB [Candidatus Micrarchaeota archaeon]